MNIFFIRATIFKWSGISYDVIRTRKNYYFQLYSKPNPAIATTPPNSSGLCVVAAVANKAPPDRPHAKMLENVEK